MRKPKWFWVLTCAVAPAMAIVHCLGWALGGLLTYCVVPHRTAIGERCTEAFLGPDCTRVHPHVITELTKMRLPPGTRIESSRYQQAMDWSLRATFVLPAEGVAAWERSLEAYPPAKEQHCTELAGRGTGRRCTGSPDTSAVVFREYTRVTESDGSVVVAVSAFTI